MNRRQLIEALATHFEGNKKQAAQALDAVLDTITREVARGEKVAIKGFGAFEKAVRPARMVRNPSTGELIQASAKVVLRFRPSAQLRDVISGAAQLPARTLGAAMAAGGALMGRTDAARSDFTSTSDSEHALANVAESAPVEKTPSGTTTKTPAKKTTAKKTTAKKATAKKATAKQATAKKTTAKETTAKKDSTSGAPTKKSAAAKKTTSGTTTKKSTAAKKTTSGTPTKKSASGSAGAGGSSESPSASADRPS